jgi:hypothetical protein
MESCRASRRDYAVHHLQEFSAFCRLPAVGILKISEGLLMIHWLPQLSVFLPAYIISHLLQI